MYSSRFRSVGLIGLLSMLLIGLVTFAQQNKAAKAELRAAPGSNVRGVVTFLDIDKGTKIIFDISGLEPGSVHGVHIHEQGLCDPPSFASAGGHYNPTQALHGSPASEHRHVGDFGNLVANKSGVAKVEMLIPEVKLRGDTSVIGRSIVLHAKPDDLFSQPSGDSGDRIACGVIEAAKTAPRDIQR